MAMKKVYSTKTGKVTWAQPNPARPGEYLMPADATEFPPPAFDDTSKKAKYINNSWVTEDLTPEEIHEASGSTGTFIGQLDDIGNITLDSVTDGQALVWDAENNKWTNGNVAAGESSGSVDGSGVIYEKSSVGMIAPFAMSTKPDGWLICDGSTLDSVTNTEYATLYDAIGTTWGGSGPSDFKLPDLRGSFLRGIGTGSINGRDKFGPNNVGEFQEDEFQGHRHDFKAYAFANNNNNNYKEMMFGNGVSPLNIVTGGGVYDPKSDGTNDTPRTGDETRPYNAGILYCIKYSENEIQTIVDSQTNVDGPCFHVLVGGSNVDTRKQTPLLFNVIKTNHTNSYNTATGLFTAPEDGYYYFGAGAHRSSPDGWTTIRLYVGGEIISNAWGNDNESNNGQLFCSGVKYMYTGDTAYVSMDSSKATNYMTETYWYFNGYKIANGNTTVNITSGSSIDGINNVNGKLGIFTDSPDAELTLASLNTSEYMAGLSIGTHSKNNESDIALSMNSVINGDNTLSLAANSQLLFYTGTTDRLTGVAGGTERMRINNDGRVGIGITPHHNLHLAGDSSQYGSALKIEENTHGTSARAGIHMGDWVIGQDAPGDGTKDFFFYNAGHRLFIKDDGRIGINNTNPRAALAIKGGYVEDSPNQGHGVDISSRDLHAKIEFSASDGCFLDFGKGNGSDFSGRLWYSHPHKVMDFYVEQKHRFRVHETGVWLPTDHGAINIACEGHGYAHFRTDQSYFFFDRQCQASGGFVTYSDERLKENVAVVENAVESLKKIRGVSFTWKKNADSQTRREGKMFGVLAQEVQQIDPAMCELPEAVTDGDEKFYTFDYSNLTPYFIEAIKEQQATIESQQAKIDSLEARLAALEAKLS